MRPQNKIIEMVVKDMLSTTLSKNFTLLTESNSQEKDNGTY